MYKNKVPKNKYVPCLFKCTFSHSTFYFPQQQPKKCPFLVSFLIFLWQHKDYVQNSKTVMFTKSFISIYIKLYTSLLYKHLQLQLLKMCIYIDLDSPEHNPIWSHNEHKFTLKSDRVSFTTNINLWWNTIRSHKKHKFMLKSDRVSCTTNINLRWNTISGLTRSTNFRDRKASLSTHTLRLNTIWPQENIIDVKCDRTSSKYNLSQITYIDILSLYQATNYERFVCTINSAN